MLVDGKDDRRVSHGVPSALVQRRQITRGVLVLPAWTGLPRTIIYAGVAGAVFWWTFSLWLNWGYRPQWDAAGYILFGQWWIEGNIDELTTGLAGTLARPYVYGAAIGALGNLAPTVLATQNARAIIAAVQVASFAAAAFRLAGAIARFERGLSQAVVVGLLCTPFAVLTNNEVLSEGVSLTISCLLVAVSCPTGSSVSGRLGNVAAVFLCLALLAMTRSAHLPVSLGATGAILLVLSAVAVRRVKNRRYVASGLAMAVVGLFGWVVIAAPQAWLMWQHTNFMPNDSWLWGVGGAQLLWSQQMGKFAGVIVNCPAIPGAGVVYPVPFADATNATGYFTWYLKNPHVSIFHLFQALNWDFPTIYISTFNPFVTVPLNAVSLGVAVIGFATLMSVGPSLVRRLIAEAPVLGIVLVAIVGLWLQTAFTAVETRFGIIPWSALSVAAAWGAAQWWERLRSGTSGWLPAINAVVATGVLLVISRLAVAGVPAFQQLEAAGCWR